MMDSAPAILERFQTQHENDVVPVVLWFLTAHALGFVAYQLAEYAFLAMGHTSTMTVMLVGGGASTPMQWQVASYQAMQVQGVAFLLSFGAFWAWNAGVLSRW